LRCLRRRSIIHGTKHSERMRKHTTAFDGRMNAGSRARPFRGRGPSLSGKKGAMRGGKGGGGMMSGKIPSPAIEFGNRRHRSNLGARVSRRKKGTSLVRQAKEKKKNRLGGEAYEGIQSRGIVFPEGQWPRGATKLRGNRRGGRQRKKGEGSWRIGGGRNGPLLIPLIKDRGGPFYLIIKSLRHPRSSWFEEEDFY